MYSVEANRYSVGEKEEEGERRSEEVSFWLVTVEARAIIYLMRPIHSRIERS